MYKCHVCGSTAAREELTSELFQLAGRQVLVEQIPAQVCARCGEATFSRETTERIRRLLHGKTKPAKTIKLDVFALS